MKNTRLLMLVLLLIIGFSSCVSYPNFHNTHRYHYHTRAHWHDGISHYY